MKTNAARLLDHGGIPYRLLTYEFPQEEFDAVKVARLLNLPAGMVFKTLILRGDRTGLLVACIPSDAELNMKLISTVSGNKTAAMIPVKDIQPLTGYVRGAVSPLGMKKKFPTFIHDSALAHDEIGISGGKKGVEIVLKCTDFCSITQGVIVPIIKEPTAPDSAYSGW